MKILNYIIIIYFKSFHFIQIKEKTKTKDKEKARFYGKNGRLETK